MKVDSEGLKWVDGRIKKAEDISSALYFPEHESPSLLWINQTKGFDHHRLRLGFLLPPRLGPLGRADFFF